MDELSVREGLRRLADDVHPGPPPIEAILADADTGTEEIGRAHV